MQLARGVLIAGKYRIERPLATGGMGSVWVARHAQLDTTVAVKFMDPQSASSAVARARFEREAKASAALRNRHVVQVLDYGLESDAPYLVMELLQGEDLSKRLHRERRLSLAAASRILTQAAKGLRTAHDARIVHRDLKPANIFLAREADEDEEIVKILDFGIAKDANNPRIGEGTKTGELMGSPHYMSPEQVRAAKDIDHRSDLWSLAVIMFRAVTGRMPFAGDNIGVVIAQILADPIPVATEIAPDLPADIDAFFARGFARDREQRFQTAREMAEAFAALATSASEPSARWSMADEGPTRPRMPSNYPIETVADVLPPSSTRADLPSIPTEAMAPPSEAPATPSATFAPGALGGTGGPLIQTTRPPASPSPLRWLPLAGAATGVLIGVVAFFAVRPGSRATAAAPVGTTTPIDSATATATATAVSTGEAPKPEPAPAETQPVAASASASTMGDTPKPPAAPSSKATSKPKEAAAPAKQPAPSPAAKKKPNWGF